MFFCFLITIKGLRLLETETIKPFDCTKRGARKLSSILSEQSSPINSEPNFG